MSLDTHANALKAYLTAQMPTFQGVATEALDLDEVKKRQADGTLPLNYIEVYLTRRFGGNVRGDQRENNLRRVSTRIIAYSPTNGRIIEDQVAAAFSVPVDLGDRTALIEYESGGGTFEYDGDRYVFEISDWIY